VRAGLLSRPCARMETPLGEFALGASVALCLILIFAMLGFGHLIFEWLEGT